MGQLLQKNMDDAEGCNPGCWWPYGEHHRTRSVYLWQWCICMLPCGSSCPLLWATDGFIICCTLCTHTYDSVWFTVAQRCHNHERAAVTWKSRVSLLQVNKDGQDHQVSAASFNMGSPDSQLFIQQYQLFVKALLRSTRCDNVLLMLLIVMTTFSPDRVRPSSIAVVAEIQEEYGTVLREYVAMRYPSEPLMLAHLLQQLCDVRDLNEKHTMMLLNMKLEDLEPLIIEIFDLSPSF